nr:diaminopimelate epimerase [uncultured Albidiferax sp.]
MPICFQKMHANGDDFAIVDARHAGNPITAAIARRLGDRRRGIGFNQLAVMLPCTDAAARLVFWNADGSVLDVCGSATRGVADVLMREAGTSAITLQSPRGLLVCERTPSGHISVDMGPPLLGWQDVPLAEPLDTVCLPLAGEPTACSMGNPHCTYFVDDVARVDLATVGPLLEVHPLFPLKSNVHFVQVIDRSHIRLRIWERGGGIPLGSGSCACAAAVGGIRRGLLDPVVEVECDGGSVVVRWEGAGSVFLAGPVAPIYVGTVADGWLQSVADGTPLKSHN